MTPANAKRLHESKLTVEENGAELLANAAVNPTTRTVNHWFETWRKEHYGAGETDFDPISKLKEKSSMYKEQGMFIVRVQMNMHWKLPEQACKCALKAVKLCTENPEYMHYFYRTPT